MLSQDGRRAASISLTPPSDVVPRWDMEPGDCLSRLDRQATFGGGVDSRVERSDATADIFVYARQNFVSGGDSGYDGWSEDRTIFLFAGEGSKVVSNSIPLMAFCCATVRMAETFGCLSQKVLPKASRTLSSDIWVSSSWIQSSPLCG